MIFKCKIISYNKYLQILVFEYEGKQIQVSIVIPENQEYVYVKYKDGKFEIKDKDEEGEIIPSNKNTKKQTRSKSTGTKVKEEAGVQSDNIVVE